MPTEFRRIVFNNLELHEALRGHPDPKAQLPGGRLLTIRFEDEGRNQLAIEFHDPLRGQPPETVTLATPFVAAALLRYCIAKRIPVQRSAQKSLSISGDNIALDLRSPSKAVTVPATEPGAQTPS